MQKIYKRQEVWMLVNTLTHYQTTNYRLLQTKKVCRQQFQIRRKWQKVIQMGRKHCGKRRNCSHSDFKRLVSKRRQKVLLCENGLIRPIWPISHRVQIIVLYLVWNKFLQLILITVSDCVLETLSCPCALMCSVYPEIVSAFT